MKRTYGAYRFGHAWNEFGRPIKTIELRMEPMAATRFKRVFERAEKREIDHIAIAANPENARELEWFMDRYPLRAQRDADAKLLDKLAREFDSMLDAIAEITDPDYQPPMVELALPPRPYQLLPPAMMAATGGVLCGDDVGLGKTVIAIIGMLKPDCLPALVVTKTDLPAQWEAEVRRFAPALRTAVPKVGSPMKGRWPQDIAKRVERGEPLPDVFITSWSKLDGWCDWLIGKLQPRAVFWDEVQEVRHGFKVTSDNPNRRNLAARAIAYSTPHRMGLSATPIHNMGSEIHNVLEVIMPGTLGEMAEFRREWCGSGGVVKEPTVLGSYLRERGLYVRRTKKDVGRELPEVTITHHYCETDPKAIAELKSSSRAIALAKMILEGPREAAFTAQGEFDMFVRQQTGIAKAPYVAEFVRMLLEGEKSVLLYGWHHAVYDIWAEELAAFKPVFFTGRETQRKKREAKRAFIAGESKVIVMSLRAGAGVDGLQHVASNVVFGELDWTPAVHEQCIGRLDRDGQPEPVNAWYLVADEGSDPEIASTLGIKLAQLNGIRNPKGDVLVGRIDQDAIKRVAASFLESIGETFVVRGSSERDDPGEAA